MPPNTATLVVHSSATNSKPIENDLIKNIKHAIWRIGVFDTDILYVKI